MVPVSPPHSVLSRWRVLVIASTLTLFSLVLPSIAVAGFEAHIGYKGLAYAVPAQGATSVSGTIAKPNGVVVAAQIPAGQPFRTESLAPNFPSMVAVYTPKGRVRTARTNMWKIPDFVELQRMKVTINGVEKSLGYSGLRYLNANAARFDDPATPYYDGIDVPNRNFLNCTANSWGLGTQKFAADLLIFGIHRNSIPLIEKGIAAMDWGVARQNTVGRYLLGRTCAGKVLAPIEDGSSTHGMSQFVEATGRAALSLAGSQYAGRYRMVIDRYMKSTTLGAEYLSTPTVWKDWMTKWAQDSLGRPFVHKRYIMSSVMSYGAAMANNAPQAYRLAYIGDLIARNGFSRQVISSDPSLNGINPERGGHDAFYQGWGVLLGGRTYAMWSPTSSSGLKMADMVNRGISWMNTRTDPQTGAFDITGSTRTCREKHGNILKTYDPYPAVELLLYWGMKFNRSELISRAIKMDSAQKAGLNPCPVV